MFVFAKLNNHENVSTEVLVPIVSKENLFKIFFNHFLFFKKNQRLKTTFLNFRTFSIPETSYGYGIFFIHPRRFIHEKKLRMPSVKVNSRQFPLIDSIIGQNLE